MQGHRPPSLSLSGSGTAHASRSFHWNMMFFSGDGTSHAFHQTLPSFHSNSCPINACPSTFLVALFTTLDLPACVKAPALPAFPSSQIRVTVTCSHPCRPSQLSNILYYRPPAASRATSRPPRETHFTSFTHLHVASRPQSNSPTHPVMSSPLAWPALVPTAAEQTLERTGREPNFRCGYARAHLSLRFTVRCTQRSPQPPITPCPRDLNVMTTQRVLGFLRCMYRTSTTVARPGHHATPRASVFKGMYASCAALGKDGRGFCRYQREGKCLARVVQGCLFSSSITQESQNDRRAIHSGSPRHPLGGCLATFNLTIVQCQGGRAELGRGLRACVRAK